MRFQNKARFLKELGIQWKHSLERRRTHIIKEKKFSCLRGPGLDGKKVLLRIHNHEPDFMKVLDLH